MPKLQNCMTLEIYLTKTVCVFSA